MIPKIFEYITCFFLLSTSFFALAEKSATRSYPLPDHGNIQFSVPTSWKEEVQQSSARIPSTIVFTPKIGSSFQILLTPMFLASNGIAIPTLVEIRTNLERSLESARSQAVEKNIPIEELRGTSSVGYYFSITDKAPKSGEYKNMTQGTFRLKELIFTFTILTNEEAKRVAITALAMLKDAVYIENKMPEARPTQTDQDMDKYFAAGAVYTMQVRVEECRRSYGEFGDLAERAAAVVNPQPKNFISELEDWFRRNYGQNYLAEGQRIGLKMGRERVSERKANGKFTQVHCFGYLSKLAHDGLPSRLTDVLLD